MIRKTMLLALSVGALIAFAAPAVANAQLLYEEGPLGEHNALAVNAEVTATSENLVTEVTANGARLECTLVTIHGKVLQNTATTSRVGETVVTVEGCNHEIVGQSTGEITFEPNEVGLVHDATFESPPCHFTGDIPFSYGTNTDTLTVTGIDQLTGNCGPAQMEGSFTLETSNETPVYIT